MRGCFQAEGTDKGPGKLFSGFSGFFKNAHFFLPHLIRSSFGERIRLIIKFYFKKVDDMAIAVD